MATVEYTAITLVVAAVVAAGGAAADAERLPAAVGAGMRRALCVVAGGGCDAAGRPRACVVSSLARTRDAHLQLAIVRLADGRRLLRERLSDGTFRITVVQSSVAGGAVRAGMRLDVRGLELDVSAGAHATAGAGFGRTFVVRGEAVADRLVARLNGRDWKVGGVLKGLATAGGEEVEQFFELQSGGAGRASLSALGFDAGAVSALLDRAGALRLDRRTGERTLVLRDELRGELDARLARITGAGGVARALEPVLDRRNRPTAFVLRGAGGTASARHEVEAHLDLRDARARTLADRLLGGDPGALRPLVDQLWDDARIEARRYAVTPAEASSSGTGLGPVEAGVERTAVRARLVSAIGRDPGLGWTRRLDCELAAGAPLAA